MNTTPCGRFAIVADGIGIDCHLDAGHEGDHHNHGYDHTWSNPPPTGMPTLKLPRPSRVRIVRTHAENRAHVYIDDVDISGQVTAVSWSVNAHDQLPRATVTFMDVDIDAEADNPQETTAPARDVEFRAYDLAVLDIRPGDKILLRSPLNITHEEFEILKARFRSRFPDNEVLLLEGGLDISVLRPAAPLAAQFMDSIRTWCGPREPGTTDLDPTIPFAPATDGQPWDPSWYQVLGQYYTANGGPPPPGTGPIGAALLNKAIDWWNARAEHLTQETTP